MATLLSHVHDYAAKQTPATICQHFYVLSAAGILVIAMMPDSLQRLLMQYGARSSGSSNKQSTMPTRDGRSLSIRFVTWATSVSNVSHSWFIHFYALSLCCSIFWAVEFFARGKLLEIITQNQTSRPSSSMTMEQVQLAWFLMGLQGARRMYEYLAVMRSSSSSNMWIVHWLLGNAFYLCTSVAVWVEGSRSIRDSTRTLELVLVSSASGWSQEIFTPA
ncbi:hypothetical protein GGR57DRAFT_496771 [Xylariaceae sp. FL1272]|nr:hypothetical protein GGR57DRAFT_496771 [Xylariaceae sp. FL1272]